MVNAGKITIVSAIANIAFRAKLCLVDCNIVIFCEEALFNMKLHLKVAR